MQNNELHTHELSEELIKSIIKDRRSERRWKNFRFFITLLIIALIAVGIFSANTPMVSEGEGEGYVALLRLDGMIAPGEQFSAEEVIPKLSEAFRDPHAKGVILDINSGGGTPVQASIIHDAIVDLKHKYHKKVIVVGEDVMASGAYFIAVAGDKIYVNANSITGSIGVVMKGFGFPELIKKIGIERRVFTAGVNKDRLDPFLPQNKEDLEKMQAVTKEVHGNFIKTVMEGRKGKLVGSESELFSGDFWTGETALKLGLVDAIGNLSDAMHNEFKVNRYKKYAGTPSFIKSLAGQFGASMGSAITNEKMKMVTEF